MILVLRACFYINNKGHQKDRIDNCLKQSQLKRKRKMRGKKNNLKLCSTINTCCGLQQCCSLYLAGKKSSLHLTKLSQYLQLFNKRK